MSCFCWYLTAKLLTTRVNWIDRVLCFTRLERVCSSIIYAFFVVFRGAHWRANLIGVEHKSFCGPWHTRAHWWLCRRDCIWPWFCLGCQSILTLRTQIFLWCVLIEVRSVGCHKLCSISEHHAIEHIIYQNRFGFQRSYFTGKICFIAPPILVVINSLLPYAECSWTEHSILLCFFETNWWHFVSMNEETGICWQFGTPSYSLK